MSASQKNIIIAFVSILASFFLTGCELAGNLATERDSEKKIPAEFKLADTEGKIAIVAVQPAWIKAPMDMRVVLTEAFNLRLQEKAKIKEDRLIPYEEILKARQSMPVDKKDSAFDIAGKVSAKYVIIVQITDFDLATFAEKDFYNGSMQAKTCLYDMNETQLWPNENKSDISEIAYSSEKDTEKDIEKDIDCKITAVGIEAEKGTVKLSVERLAMATAHCVVRHFYNCPKPQFKIAEEQKKYDSYTW